MPNGSPEVTHTGPRLKRPLRVQVERSSHTLWATGPSDSTPSRWWPGKSEASCSSSHSRGHHWPGPASASRMACSANVSPTCTRVARCLRRSSNPDTFQLAHSAEPATSSPRLYTRTQTAFHPVDSASTSSTSHNASSAASLRSTHFRPPLCVSRDCACGHWGEHPSLPWTPAFGVMLVCGRHAIPPWGSPPGNWFPHAGTREPGTGTSWTTEAMTAWAVALRMRASGLMISRCASAAEASALTSSGMT